MKEQLELDSLLKEDCKVLRPELNFLLKEDSNILGAEILENKEETVGISLIVGMNDKQMGELLDLVDTELISKILTEFEIVLTKGDLKRLNKAIKEYKKS